MGFWKTLRFWVKDTFQSRGDSVKQRSDLMRTIMDATHVRGGGGQGGDFSSREEAYRHAIEGHENYQKSFEKD